VQQIHNNQSLWQYFRQHRLASIIAGHIIVASVLGLVFLDSAFGPAMLKTFAQAPCASGDQTYIVANGDTVGSIAARHNMTWQSLASHNRLSNPNMIYVAQRLCIPASKPSTNISFVAANTSAAVGSGNPFPYPACTWWADQRYHALHGIYVPWMTNSDAFLWTQRAYQFGWHVSSTPSAGAIINLQPGVQGASYLGHVAVVEQVLGNGDVIASNLSWGANPTVVTDVEFSPGSGVTFISI
jgi:surface antigen